MEKLKKIQKKTFVLTDSCMWEKNKQDGTNHPHAIEVVDLETGEVRFIKSGSQIKFVNGNISEGRNQEDYNLLTPKQK